MIERIAQWRRARRARRLLARELQTLAEQPSITGLFITTRVRGEPGNGASCPVALWLTERIGAPIRVTPHSAWYAGEQESTAVALPVRVKDFIRRFDSGYYPALRASPKREG